MKKYLYILVSGFVSGLLIAIGATVYLSILQMSHNEYLGKIIGSLFFGVGLYGIIIFETWLYTGKVGNTLNEKPSYLFDLLVCVVGNLIGVILLSFVISLTRYGASLQEVATTIVEQKHQDSWYSILILAFLCGVMIYIACKGHAICFNPVGKVILCFLAVAVFILCGFEHVVANAAYYTFARFFDPISILHFALMALGNGLGAISFDGLLKLISHLKVSDRA
ncbi:MAG: formate/nitrite transporter family protein [Bacilli bacterium]|nr:formate/nitrite transporter family protein [Bacilli bacterium]